MKLSEISELVKRLGFVSVRGYVSWRALSSTSVAGSNGAFEVEVQLGLGQAADEFLDFRHRFSLAG
jgi:hypothetical protein